MNRISKIILTFLLLISGVSWAQTAVLIRTDPQAPGVVNLKWYPKDLFLYTKYNVYRKLHDASPFLKLNNKPVQFRAYHISAQELSADTTLKAYTGLVSKGGALKGIAFLSVLIKSFRSDPFAKHLGIRFDDTSALRGNSYKYKITGVTAAGEEVTLGESLFSYDTHTPIGPPQDISFKTTKNKVSFKWLPETDRYFGVNIFRRDSGELGFRKLTPDPIIISRTENGREQAYGEVFFLDQGLTEGMRYEYTFEAIDFFGSPGQHSPIVEVRLQDATAPSYADSLHHKVDGKKISLGWRKKQHESDFVGFAIYRSTDSDTGYVRVSNALLGGHERSFGDSVAFGVHFYKVAAVDRFGNESLSNMHAIEVADNEPPDTPVGLKLTSDSGSIRLSWSANGEKDMEGYLIYRTIGSDNREGYVKLTPLPVADTTFTEALPANAKNSFFYKIVAVDRSLNRSAYSSAASIRMPDRHPPSPPFISSVRCLEESKIEVKWFANAEPDLAGYHIYCKRDTVAAERLNINIIPWYSTAYTDRHARPGGIGNYYLVAADSTGNLSQESNHFKFRLQAKKTDEASFESFRLRYNASKNHMQVTWRLSNDKSVMGVVVYRRESSDDTFSPISGLNPSQTFFDKDVAPDRNYTYEARAYNRQGAIVRSEKINIHTK